LYERMKGVEYLDFFGEVYGLKRQHRRDRALSLMKRFGLGNALDKRLGEYSKGMKQKLALVRAMLHDPPVLLLDEPTSAMDPESAKQVRDAIIELRRDERTFLITTHNLTEAQLLADRIAIIRHGRIIANGTLDELAQQFVGEPIMELRIYDSQASDLQADLASMVNIENYGDTWLQYTTAQPNITNPEILARCHELGVKVVTLSQATKTLEDIYLRIVREDENIAQHNGMNQQVSQTGVEA
jgi:ABC-2 type transport system ATP-binding protein